MAHIDNNYVQSIEEGFISDGARDVVGMEDMRCVHNTLEVYDIIVSVTWVI